MRTPICSSPLYRRVHNFTVDTDEGVLAMLGPQYPLLPSLLTMSPITLSPTVLNDRRRQHLVVFPRHSHRRSASSVSGASRTLKRSPCR